MLSSRSTALRGTTLLLLATLLTTAALFSAAAGAHGNASEQLGSSRLLSQTPIQAVRAAARLARAGAPIPSSLNPPSAGAAGPDLPSACLPSFGSGLAYQLCSMGAVGSPHVVVLLGDSHASMWVPGMVAVARQLNFRLVPLSKPGCALWSLHENRPGWPCLQWWESALRALDRLRPSATVVSFLSGNFTVAQAPFAARALEQVMRAVPHPVLLADPPSDDWYTPTVPTPAQCMASAGANLGRCALTLTPAIRASLAQIGGMVVRDGYPAIPTLQWFCAAGVCPTVVAGTVTSEDGNHITPQYALRLAPRLAGWLGPLLHRMWRAERSGRPAA